MKVVLGGYFNGFLFDNSRGYLVISHRLFVDDTPIIWDAYSTHLHYLRYFFICFEPILVLRIILCNSKLGPEGKIVNIEKLVGNLGCHVLKYLGYCWELISRQGIYGILFKRECIRNWLVGRNCTYQREAYWL